MKLVAAFLAAAVLLVPVWAAAGQDRQHIEFFSKDGQRRGYGVVDRKQGTINTYDKYSNRTGSGTIHKDGSVTIFSDGQNSKPEGRGKGKR